MPSLFFSVIGLMMGAAAALQLYYGSQLDDCTNFTTDITMAPNLAGLSLIISFIFNGIWLWSKRDKLERLRRVAMVLWLGSVMIGTVAAGAALGQVELISESATSTCDVDSYVFLHYVSIILLILSVILPHAKRKDKHEPEDDAGAPLTKMEPLRFL